MRRVTCAAEGLRSFVPCGPDEYVGLLMPPVGRPLVMPDPEPVNVRASVAALADADRPALRWYTIRDHDPVLGHVDIDIMTHGDSGPGSAWTCRARRGDPVGIRASGALYRGLEVSGRQVLVADETAVPSVAAILDAWGGADDARDQGVEVHVEVADPAVLDSYDLGDVTVHHRSRSPRERTGAGAGPCPRAPAPGRSAMRGRAARPDSSPGRDATLLRHGVDRHSIFYCGYWKLGRPPRLRPHHACRSVGSSSMTTWNFSAMASQPHAVGHHRLGVLGGVRLADLGQPLRWPCGR